MRGWLRKSELRRPLEPALQRRNWRWMNQAQRCNLTVTVEGSADLLVHIQQ